MGCTGGKVPLLAGRAVARSSLPFPSYSQFRLRTGETRPWKHKAQAGLIEDRDIVLDVVWSSGDPDQAVSEVLRRGAEVLIPCGSSASVAAKRQTSSIPIVFLSVGDPKAMGLVETLSHPGRNATGFSDILADLSGKLVDLARELSKPQTTVDYLWYTAWPDGQNRYHATEQAAQAAGPQPSANWKIHLRR